LPPPPTRRVGAILLTGYLGGGDRNARPRWQSAFSHVLFGVYLGIALWGGLWLRNGRVRAVLPVG